MEAFLLFALVALGIFQFIQDASTRYIVSIIILALTLAPAGFYMISKVVNFMRKKYCQKEAAETGQEEEQETPDLYLCNKECLDELTSE